MRVETTSQMTTTESIIATQPVRIEVPPISQTQPKTTKVKTGNLGRTKRFRAPEPPLQGVEFEDHYIEDSNKADTYLTPGNKYLAWAAQIERKEKELQPSAPPQPKPEFLINPNILTGATPPPTFEQSQIMTEEGEGDPIDPGSW